MKRIITSVLVLTLGASLAMASDVDRRANRRDVRRAQHQLRMAKLAERLDLTVDQKEQIKATNRAFREQNGEFLKSFRENRAAMRAARRANDEKRIAELEPALQEQRKHMRELRAAQRQRIDEVLTSEQRKQLEEIRARRQRGR